MPYLLQRDGTKGVCVLLVIRVVCVFVQCVYLFDVNICIIIIIIFIIVIIIIIIVIIIVTIINYYYYYY